MNSKLATTFILSAIVSSGMSLAEDFDQDFSGQTMRLDLYHTGNATEETVTLERVRIEGPWPGSRSQLIDTSNLGKYFFEVVDLASQRILYSRGFASIYGEWETTGEANSGTMRTLPEALRFPAPRSAVQVRLRKRQSDQSFREIWDTTIDPNSRFVDRSAVPTAGLWSVQENGAPAVKVDLLILGDGYTADEMTKFHNDAKRLTEDLFSLDPFASHRSDFNVWAIDSPSEESGISRPRSGVFRASPLGTSYNSLDSERYVLSLNDRAWRDVAAAAPYDFVLILVNNRKYGGGGIYNLYSTAAADSSYSRYLVIHEFGHHFAGLGDEYFTSDTAYEDFQGGILEPTEPNITALSDPDNLKWKDLVETGTPLPTPWNKQEFEEASRANQEVRRKLRAAGAPEEELERLFDEEQAQMTEMLGSTEYAGKIGAFEGASYQSQGLYRPAADCIMFTRDEVGFCAVCARGIERVISMYTK
jgi:hypothetical protein